ncbi:LOW QUALITY PROTEIN: hypothetical protein PHMEG_00027620 [Phytophthora megakarya]|uniref:Cleavage induced protein n=1 Tax=Phytophthora megakarya TaxID=4795 RepID=A0A225V8H9_9STRA|nr:LOW QUALITY PROTEIN: hypothetical protein PHMEG_00027620 [Phytophthora megakarya]
MFSLRVVNGSKHYTLDTSTQQAYLPSYNFSVARQEQIHAQIRRLRFQITCPGGIRTRIELSGDLSCEAALSRLGGTSLRSPPPNHRSAQLAFNMLIKGILKGKDQSRYLVLDIGLRGLLKDVTCSPFGANYSRPLLSQKRSVNDNSPDDSTIPVKYSGAAVLARRKLKVEEPGAVKILTGDVHGAFRNIPLEAVAAGRFARTIPDLGVLIIDLSCPFGWTESPGHYWSAGAAINHFHSNYQPTWPDQPRTGVILVDGKAWCDDHICIEPDIGTRLTEASLSLRAAMTGVLGPDACNEQNFSQWFREGTALGLTWNVNTMSLSISPDKISKAISRLQDTLSASTTFRRELNNLLGSLWHVSTCILSTRPFSKELQRWLGLHRVSARRYTLVPLHLGCGLIEFGTACPISRATRSQILHYDGCKWSGSVRRIPLQQQYLQVEYTQGEREEIAPFNTTGEVDEHHIRDNSVGTIMGGFKYIYSSTCPALLEVRYIFYSSAGHIARETNIMADAGSWPREISTRFESASPDRRSRRNISSTLRAGLESVGNMVPVHGYQPWLNEHDLNANAAQLGAFAVYIRRFGMNQQGEGNTCGGVAWKWRDEMRREVWQPDVAVGRQRGARVTGKDQSDRQVI